jgi:predicted Zn finger-like uncharacterized protein
MIISCPSCGASFNVQPEALGTTGRAVKCSKCAHRWRVLPDGTAEEEPAADLQAATAQAAPDDGPSDAALGPPGDDAPAEQQAEADGAVESAELPEAAEPAAVPSFRLRDALGDAVPDDDAPDDDRPDDDGTAGGGAGRKLHAPVRKPRRSAGKVISLFVLILLISGVASVALLMEQQVMMWLPATQRLYAMIGVEPSFLGRGLQIVEPKPKKEIDGNDEILVVEGEVRNTTGGPIDVPLMRGALLDKKGKELHIWTFTAAKPQIAPGETARYRTEFRNPPTEAESLDITFTHSDGRMETATQEVKVQSDPPPPAAPQGN